MCGQDETTQAKTAGTMTFTTPAALKDPFQDLQHAGDGEAIGVDSEKHQEVLMTTFDYQPSGLLKLSPCDL
ncbi:hypothetical protein P7K49_011685, partial [Saguinus oedipus]